MCATPLLYHVRIVTEIAAAAGEGIELVRKK